MQANATLFKNQGDCVSYAVRGGTPTPKTEAQLICESQGGTYKIIRPEPLQVHCADLPQLDSDEAINAALEGTSLACLSLGVSVAFFEIADEAVPGDRGAMGMRCLGCGPLMVRSPGQRVAPF